MDIKRRIALCMFLVFAIALTFSFNASFETVYAAGSQNTALEKAEAAAKEAIEEATRLTKEAEEATRTATEAHEKYNELYQKAVFAGKRDAEGKYTYPGLAEAKKEMHETHKTAKQYKAKVQASLKTMNTAISKRTEERDKIGESNKLVGSGEDITSPENLTAEEMKARFKYVVVGDDGKLHGSNQSWWQAYKYGTLAAQSAYATQEQLQHNEEQGTLYKTVHQAPPGKNEVYGLGWDDKSDTVIKKGLMKLGYLDDYTDPSKVPLSALTKALGDWKRASGNDNDYVSTIGKSNFEQLLDLATEYDIEEPPIPPEPEWDIHITELTQPTEFIHGVILTKPDKDDKHSSDKTVEFEVLSEVQGTLEQFAYYNEGTHVGVVLNYSPDWNEVASTLVFKKGLPGKETKIPEKTDGETWIQGGSFSYEKTYRQKANGEWRYYYSPYFRKEKLPNGYTNLYNGDKITFDADRLDGGKYTAYFANKYGGVLAKVPFEIAGDKIRLLKFEMVSAPEDGNAYCLNEEIRYRVQFECEDAKNLLRLNDTEISTLLRANNEWYKDNYNLYSERLANRTLPRDTGYAYFNLQTRTLIRASGETDPFQDQEYNKKQYKITRKPEIKGNKITWEIGFVPLEKGFTNEYGRKVNQYSAMTSDNLSKTFPVKEYGIQLTSGFFGNSIGSNGYAAGTHTPINEILSYKIKNEFNKNAILVSARIISKPKDGAAYGKDEKVSYEVKYKVFDIKDYKKDNLLKKVNIDGSKTYNAAAPEIDEKNKTITYTGSFPVKGLNKGSRTLNFINNKDKNIAKDGFKVKAGKHEIVSIKIISEPESGEAYTQDETVIFEIKYKTDDPDDFEPIITKTVTDMTTYKDITVIPKKKGTSGDIITYTGNIPLDGFEDGMHTVKFKDKDGKTADTKNFVVEDAGLITPKNEYDITEDDSYKVVDHAKKWRENLRTYNKATNKNRRYNTFWIGEKIVTNLWYKGLTSKNTSKIAATTVSLYKCRKTEELKHHIYTKKLNAPVKDIDGTVAVFKQSTELMPDAAKLSNGTYTLVFRNDTKEVIRIELVFDSTIEYYLLHRN